MRKHMLEINIRERIVVVYAICYIYIYRMKILCVICYELLVPSEDIFFTPCGHVFHHCCLLQWLQRSKTCPQCRDEATEDRIHKAHFMFSSTEILTDNTDNISLQGRIDSLKFQIMLNEKNIKHYTTKNATLERQNAGLRQEVRKVESEINQKNSAIYALKEQIKYFKGKYLEYENMKKKLSQKEKEVGYFRDMHKKLSTGTLKDVQEMAGKTTDRNTLINYISVMKQIILQKTKKIENIQSELTTLRDSLAEERSKRLKFEERLAFCESENLSLRHRINKLEKLDSSKDSLINVQAIDVCTRQINTKQEITNQDSPSSSKVEIVDNINQEYSNSIFNECPTVTKKPRLCLRSSNSSDKTSNTKNTIEINPKQKKVLKGKSSS